MAEVAFAPNPDRAIASLRNPSRAQTGLLTDDWFGLVAPKGTSTIIVEDLNNRINAIVADPKMSEQLAGLGATPRSMTPAEFEKLISDYTERWARVLQSQPGNCRARIGTTTVFSATGSSRVRGASVDQIQIPHTRPYMARTNSSGAQG
jgi:hypothetical protein